MKTTISQWSGPGPEPQVCPNCGQWKHNGRCLNDCQKHGFDPTVRYLAHFYGRTKGAIGVFYWIDTTVDASNEDDARTLLYDRFEHIQQLTLRVQP